MELSLDMNKRYTYADYLTWLDDKSRELINGFVKIMSPAPHLGHAEVNKNIYWHFESIVRKKKGKCKVFFAPFDVRLPKRGETADDKIDTVVQPNDKAINVFLLQEDGKYDDGTLFIIILLFGLLPCLFF